MIDILITIVLAVVAFIGLCLALDILFFNMAKGWYRGKHYSDTNQT